MGKESSYILFDVFFENGDSMVYRGTRVPTLNEAKAFCAPLIAQYDATATNEHSRWCDVEGVGGEVSLEQAIGLWDIPALAMLNDNQWPIFEQEPIITQENFLAGCRVLIDNEIPIDEVQHVMQALCYVMLDEETEQHWHDNMPCCQNCAHFTACEEIPYFHCSVHDLEGWDERT